MVTELNYDTKNCSNSDSIHATFRFLESERLLSFCLLFFFFSGWGGGWGWGVIVKATVTIVSFFTMLTCVKVSVPSDHGPLSPDGKALDRLVNRRLAVDSALARLSLLKK